MLKKLNMLYQTYWITTTNLIIATTIGLMLSGCVSQSKYDTLQAQQQQTQAERDTLLNEKASLEQELSSLNAELTDLESKTKQLDAELAETSSVLESKKSELAKTMEELGATDAALSSTKAKLSETADVLVTKDAALKAKEEELRKASEYMKRTNVLYDQLVGELKGEVEANQVKIKEMKDGINVNLAEEILFPSGSANLNKSGRQVIRRVSEKLLGKEYQIIVVGFTDNLPIRGTLAKTYPTNWELAGARAASVVRLLEKTGIESKKLIASSYGENNPVASNDTPEGRAQNRRIEIRLRPVQ